MSRSYHHLSSDHHNDLPASHGLHSFNCPPPSFASPPSVFPSQGLLPNPSISWIRNVATPLRLLLILLPHIQGHQKPTDKIIARHRRRNLHDPLLIEPDRAQPLKSLPIHFHIPRHLIRIQQDRPLLVAQLALRGRVQLLDDFEFGIREARGNREDGRVRVPFEPGFVDKGRAADGDFADGGGQGGFGADGAEEGVPACGFTRWGGVG